jgi:tetratricopeptide (TPR) repeat protein
VTPYEQALLLLDDIEFLRRPARWPRARTLLEHAVKEEPKRAKAHAALGYVHEMLGDMNRALPSMQEALRLDPGNKIYQVCVPTLLAWMGKERQALAEIRRIAPRHGLDLAKMRRELRAMKAPANALNLIGGFIHARNFLRSALSREAERIRNRADPGRQAREAKAQHERCVQDQRDLKRRFKAANVPTELKSLSAWAVRYGIGDDYCRPYLLKRLPREDRAKLIKALDAKAAVLQAWLDSFGQAPMPDEAAACMYLASGVEEIR